MRKYEAEVAWGQKLGDEIMACTDIWTAIRKITNAVGSEAGGHLENLLMKEGAGESEDSWIVDNTREPG